jgi:hypothetical protein
MPGRADLGLQPSTAMFSSPVNSSTVPSERCTTTAAWTTSATLISCNRSAPTEKFLY